MTQREDGAVFEDMPQTQQPRTTGRARIIVQRTSGEMAAHVGGPVATEYLTFDVDAPELAAEFAKNWDAYGTRSIVGVELLPDELLAARSPAPEGGETDPRDALLREAVKAIALALFPRNGDHGGPLCAVIARYEDGSEQSQGHEQQRGLGKLLAKIQETLRDE